jgi:hypothetical protein
LVNACAARWSVCSARPIVAPVIHIWQAARRVAGCRRPSASVCTFLASTGRAKRRRRPIRAEFRLNFSATGSTGHKQGPAHRGVGSARSTGSCTRALVLPFIWGLGHGGQVSAASTPAPGYVR